MRAENDVERRLGQLDHLVLQTLVLQHDAAIEHEAAEQHGAAVDEPPRHC